MGDHLKSLGHEVFNPAEHDCEKYGYDAFKSETGDLNDLTDIDFNLSESMTTDLDYIVTQSDGVVLLPNWACSSGAKLEAYVAKVCGRRLYEYRGTRLTDPLQEIDVEFSHMVTGLRTMHRV